MINRNDLAKEISIIEGKKQQVNIAQISDKGSFKMYSKAIIKLWR